MSPALPVGLQVLILLALFSSLEDLLRRLTSVGRAISVGDDEIVVAEALASVSGDLLYLNEILDCRSLRHETRAWQNLG